MSSSSASSGWVTHSGQKPAGPESARCTMHPVAVLSLLLRLTTYVASHPAAMCCGVSTIACTAMGSDLLTQGIIVSMSRSAHERSSAGGCQHECEGEMCACRLLQRRPRPRQPCSPLPLPRWTTPATPKLPPTAPPPSTFRRYGCL